MPTIDGHPVAISNPDKVLFPDDGITKGDLVDYYGRIAGRMLVHVRDRPLHMNRFPDGIARIAIQQKRVPDSFHHGSSGRPSSSTKAARSRMR